MAWLIIVGAIVLIALVWLWDSYRCAKNGHFILPDDTLKDAEDREDE